MRTIWMTLACVAVFVGVSSSARAQSADGPLPAPIPSRIVPIDNFAAPPTLDDWRAPDRAGELKRWIEEFTDWMTWSAQWRNRRQPGLFTSYRDRPARPAPPLWLPDLCRTSLDVTDSLMHACTLLAVWSEDDAVMPARAAATTPTEDSRKNVWWEHVHMDLLWPALALQSSIYGVVGMHTATSVKGRLQVFLAPGAMLVNLPARNGSRVWKVAANYGIGYRLADFSFPGNRHAVLHVNLAKAWLLSDISDVVSGRSTDFAGFSITLKRLR